MKSFFFQGGYRKLPWKNSWFLLAVVTAAYSAGALVYDLSGGIKGISAPSIPLFSKPAPGSLTIEAVANGAVINGATVNIAGNPSQAAPANYAQMDVGSHSVTVSAPGYESATQSVDIKSGQASSLSFNLVRTHGTLSLDTIPAHVSYTVKSNDGSTQPITGRTPVTGINLPTGDYQVTFESPRYETVTSNITIEEHKESTQAPDLITNYIAKDENANVAKVLGHAADASILSAPDKNDYIAGLNREFTEYVRVSAWPQAQSTIDALNAAGQNTQAQVQHIADIRNGYEQKVGDQVQDLISQGQLGAARSKLKSATDDMPDDASGRLITKFTPSLGPYTQQIDGAIASANAGDPQAGYTALQPLAQQHPDDPILALAMAHLLTKMPPDHDRITAQIATLQKFNGSDMVSSDASDLQQMIAKLQAEVTHLDQLQAAVDAQKKPSVGNAAEHIATLEAQIRRDQAAINGASNVNNSANNAANSVTSFFHVHVHVAPVDVSARQAEIARDQQKIQDLQNQQTASQNNSNTAQQQLDQFRAAVPW